MSLFSIKQKVKLEAFCREFFDAQILHPVIGGVNFSSAFPEVVKKSITEADTAFKAIDIDKLTNELICLRFELFALAWIHHQGEKLAMAQSLFTKHYLHGENRDDIWDSMNHYNQAVAQSTTVSLDEAEKASIYKMRMDIADSYIGIAEKTGIDVNDKAYLECLGRPINRLFSEKAWKNNTTSYYLLLALCHKLGLGSGRDYLGPNDEAKFRLSAFIHGLYDGAKQSWDNIRIID